MWKIKLVSQKFRKDYFKPLKIKQRLEMEAQQTATANIQQVEEQEVDDALSAPAVETFMVQHKDEKKAPGLLRRKAHKCDECDISFTFASSLRLHMSVHSGKSFDHLHFNYSCNYFSDERNFKCSQCPKDYKRPDHLRNHILSCHQNKRAYKCPKCPKAYKTSTHLWQHKLRVHSGENLLKYF